MRKTVFNPTVWTLKLREYLEELFDEEEEEVPEQSRVYQARVKQPEYVRQGEHMRKRDHVRKGDRVARGDTSRRVPGAWKLLRFLELALSIMTVLPVLGYISSHWTIHQVVNTRELHEQILGTALLLLLGMFFLHIAFPKIMRTILFGSLLVLGSLPLISEKQNFAGLWTKYREQVKSLPVQLVNNVQGHLYHADEVEWDLASLVFKDVDHLRLQAFLLDSGVDGEEEWSACLSLFQEVYDAWTYMPDPFYKELYRPPHRTIRNFSGDCDDYALLMATLLKTLGYRTRIIITNHHVYPELAIPDDSIYFSTVKPMIKMMPGYQREGSPPLFFHRDLQGTIWLNLDYTAAYPGGPFMSEEIFRVIDLN